MNSSSNNTKRQLSPGPHSDRGEKHAKRDVKAPTASTKSHRLSHHRESAQNPPSAAPALRVQSATSATSSPSTRPDFHSMSEFNNQTNSLVTAIPLATPLQHQPPERARFSRGERLHVPRALSKYILVPPHNPAEGDPTHDDSFPLREFLKDSTDLSKPVDEVSFSWKKLQEITGHETLWYRDNGQIWRVHNDRTLESALCRLCDGGYVADVNLRFCLPEQDPNPGAPLSPSLPLHANSLNHELHIENTSILDAGGGGELVRGNQPLRPSSPNRLAAEDGYNNHATALRRQSFGAVRPSTPNICRSNSERSPDEAQQIPANALHEQSVEYSRSLEKNLSSFHERTILNQAARKFAKPLSEGFVTEGQITDIRQRELILQMEANERLRLKYPNMILPAVNRNKSVSTKIRDRMDIDHNSLQLHIEKNEVYSFLGNVGTPDDADDDNDNADYNNDSVVEMGEGWTDL